MFMLIPFITATDILDNRGHPVGKMLTSYIFCLCLILLISNKGSAGDFLDNLWNDSTVTGDKYVFVGGDLKLTCTLSDGYLQTFTSDNISFRLDDPEQKKNGIRYIPASSVQVLNSKQAMLVVHNVTVNDAGMYSCFIGNNLVAIAEDVQVEYYPQNVINFQCVVFDWNESMSCTWEHPVEYVMKSQINVSLGYIPSSIKTLMASWCPKQGYNNCEFSSETFHLGEVYVVEINVTNIHAIVTASTTFRVETYKNVKPSPVGELTITFSDPDCFNLSWNHPKKQWKKFYRIKHQNDGDLKFSLLKDKWNITSFMSCGYLPHTSHFFSVECYPSGFSGNWSDPVIINGLTPMTAPTLGPNTTNGSYTTTSCTDGIRNVTLMWQEVEKTARNGVIDSYFIKQGNTVLKNVTMDLHQAAVQVSCSTVTVLKIYAHNEGGLSLKPSILVIPPSSFSVPNSVTDSFSAEVLDEKDTINVSWNANTNAEIMNYTIFWCLTLLRRSCEGQIHWSKMPGTHSDYNISVPSTDVQNQKYMFGISVTYKQLEMPSEIFWTQCLFTRHPSKVKSTDWINVDHQAESAKVMWNPVICSYEDQVKVTQYIIKYCEDPHCNDTNRIKHIEVPASESFYMLSGLKANTNYKLTVQTNSYGTLGQEFEPWKMFLAQGNTQPSWSALAIIAVVITVVIVGLVYFYRKCISGKRKANNLREIQILNLNDSQNSPRDFSHNLLQVISEDIMLNPPAVDTAHQYQESSTHVVIIQGSEIADQENSGCSSGECNDQQNNSRSPLIKPPSHKGGKSSFLSPTTHVSVFKSPSLEQPSESFGNINRVEMTVDYVQQNLLIHDSSQNEQWQTTEIDDQCRSNEYKAMPENLHGECPDLLVGDLGPTCLESVQSYMHVADTSLTDTSTEQLKASSQEPNTKIIYQLDHNIMNFIVKNLEQGKTTETTNTKEVDSVDQDTNQKLIETSSDKHNIVTTVAPTDTSVLGCACQDIETVRNESVDTPSTLSSESQITVSSDNNDSSDNSNSMPDTNNAEIYSTDYISNTLYSPNYPSI